MPLSTGGREWVPAVSVQCLSMAIRGQEPAVTWGGWFEVGLGQWIWGAFLSPTPRVSLEDVGVWEVHSLAGNPHPGPFPMGWRMFHSRRPLGLSSHVRLGTHPPCTAEEMGLAWYPSAACYVLVNPAPTFSSPFQLLPSATNPYSPAKLVSLAPRRSLKMSHASLPRLPAPPTIPQGGRERGWCRGLG